MSNVLFFFLQRWNPSLQTGHKEAAPARDASQCQDQWPDNATPLSCKPYFLKFYFLSLRFPFFLSSAQLKLFHADRQLGPDSLKDCALFSLFFCFTELMLCQNTLCRSPSRFHMKVGVNERQDLHTASLLLLFQTPHRTPIPAASVRL